jgi:hypothetical protein
MQVPLAGISSHLRCFKVRMVFSQPIFPIEDVLKRRDHSGRAFAEA